MTKKLIIGDKSSAVDTKSNTANNLLGRGLNAIQLKEESISDSEMDLQYQKVRNIYNSITSYGCKNRFKPELVPTEGDILKDPRLQELQPFFSLIEELKSAFIAFQKLANQNYGRAYFPLSQMFKGEQGINENLEKAYYYSCLAFEWCFSNRFSKDTEIWCDLARMYYIGCGADQNDEEAVYWYRKAAEQGNAEAQCNLSSMYEDGRGVKQNNKEALSWCKKAAKQDYAPGKNSLGMKYVNGLGVKQDNEQAIFWFRNAAEQGYENAQFNLAFMYQAGLGVKQNFEEAIFWCKKSLEQGNADAANIFASLCDMGAGIEQNHELAAFWFHQSAKQGDMQAQCALGAKYSSGMGIEQNIEKAIFWLDKAAEQGHPQAQELLTNLPLSGKNIIAGINLGES